MARHVLLLRHGQLDPAHAGRFWGRTDVPLGDAGRRQSLRIVSMISSCNVNRCLCSPLLRTRQTAEVVLSAPGALTGGCVAPAGRKMLAHGASRGDIRGENISPGGAEEVLPRNPQIDLHIDPDLREIDFGDWEGKAFTEIEQTSPGLVKQWADFADDFAFPGGESLAGFQARIRAVAQRLADDPAETLLAVTHGGVIRALICHYLGLSPRQYVLFDVRCGALTRIDLFDGRGVLAGLNLAPEGC